MKKMLCGILFCFSLAAHAQKPADSGYDFYLGVTDWYSSANGGIDAPSIHYTLQMDAQDINKKAHPEFYAAFEHPLKYLPDLLISHSIIKHDGSGTLTFVTTYPIEGSINLSHTDMTFYYNVFSDNLGFLDMGATARLYNGDLRIKFTTIATESTSDLSTTLGLLYLRTGVHTPLDGLSFGLALNGGDDGKNRSADGNLYMQYETPYGLGVSGGYHYFNTYIESKGKLGTLSLDINADFNVYGPYLSMYIHL